jgi:hypothetical protein
MKKLLVLILALSFFFTTIGIVSAACTATKKNADYSAPGGSPSNSLTAQISAKGDLVAITAWCYPACTPVSMTLGSQTAVQTSVSGNPGPGNPGTGQGFIFYVLSAAVAGPQTLTFTASGSYSGIQTSYIDFSPSAGCTFTHHVDSPLGSCMSNCGTSGNPGTITAPSITATPGDVLFNFTWSSEHINDINSPWSCPVYAGQGETGDCQFDQTRNVAAYILSAPSGPVANNTTDTHSSDTWQALITSFSMSSGTQIRNPQSAVRNEVVSPEFVPSPIRAALLKQYLRVNQSMTVFDVNGKAMDQKDLNRSGIYLIKNGAEPSVQKVMVLD